MYQTKKLTLTRLVLCQIIQRRIQDERKMPAVQIFRGTVRMENKPVTSLGNIAGSEMVQE